MLLLVPCFTTCVLAPAFEKINLGQQEYLKKKRERNELEMKYKCPYLVQKDSSRCQRSVFVRFTLDLTVQKKKL